MSINNTPSLSDSVISGGTPVVDNITVFPLAEYATRGAAGNFSKLVGTIFPWRRYTDLDFFAQPLLVTNVLNEADGVLPFSPAVGVNTTLSDEFTLASFHCPVASMANYTAQQGVPTWRYLYSGSFAETLPYSWMRPYHGSDIELILGQARPAAYQDLGMEIDKAARYIQNAVASFVRDPVNGLSEFGWPKYNVSCK